MLSILHARHHLTSHICEAPPHLTRLHTRLLFAHAKTRPRKSYGSCSFCLSYVSHTKTNAPPCTGSDIGQTPAKQSDSRMLSIPPTPHPTPSESQSFISSSSRRHIPHIDDVSPMDQPTNARVGCKCGWKKISPSSAVARKYTGIHPLQRSVL